MGVIESPVKPLIGIYNLSFIESMFSILTFVVSIRPAGINWATMSERREPYPLELIAPNS